LNRTLERFAKTKLEENEPFYRSVAGRLKDRKLGGPYICDKDGLEERIRTAIDQGEVLKAKRRYSVGREAGDSLVQFATSLHGMLAGYTDMIAVINGAVPRFGPLAYGTLSTLLLVSRMMLYYMCSSIAESSKYSGWKSQESTRGNNHEHPKRIG
jgi:hypothetical protein